MSDIEIRNAVIKSTAFGYEDHGILTCMLHLNYGGSSQGFGGYGLDTYVNGLDKRVGTAWGTQFIIEILKTLSIEKWEDLPGTNIRVKADYGKVHEIGHLLHDRWFNPNTLWEKYKNEKAPF